MDLNKPWGFASQTVDIVYASHLFEHLTHRAATLFLTESYRTLKPEGVVRIAVPDLYKTAKNIFLNTIMAKAMRQNLFCRPSIWILKICILPRAILF